MNETITNTSKTSAYYLSLIETPCSILPIPYDQRMQKRWIYARKYSNKGLQTRNQAIEMLYNNMLTRVRQLTPLPLAYPVFERNYRHENSENAFMMHAYLSNCCFFILTCDLSCNYQIEYGFNNFSFEDEIMQSLKPYLTSGWLDDEPLHDFDEFYERTLRVQDKKHISY